MASARLSWKFKLLYKLSAIHTLKLHSFSLYVWTWGHFKQQQQTHCSQPDLLDQWDTPKFTTTTAAAVTEKLLYWNQTKSNNKINIWSAANAVLIVLLDT